MGVSTPVGHLLDITHWLPVGLLGSRASLGCCSVILYFSVVWGKKRRPSTFLKDVVRGCSKDFLVKRLRSQEANEKKKKNG